MEIKPKYKHTKAGQLMFDICAWGTKIMCKYKFIYYTLAVTWGIIMTVFGLLVTAGLAIAKLFGAKVSFKKYAMVYAVSAGPDWWGGFDTGLMYVRDQRSSEELDMHEFGHTFQNCILGPLFPFLVAIPSMVRWWSIELSKEQDWSNYDAVWFEDAASECGKWAVYYLENRE